MRPALQLMMSVRDDAVVATAVGELDLVESDRVFNLIKTATTFAERVIVVDVSRLTFIDYAGTQALVLGRAEAFRRGVSLVLAAPSPALARMLARTDPQGQLTVYGSVREAINMYCGDPAETLELGAIDLAMMSPLPQ